MVTIGLEKLESSFNRNTLHAADVAEFLEQAEPSDVGTLARDGMPKALDRFQRRRTRRIESVLGTRAPRDLYMQSSPSNP